MSLLVFENSALMPQFCQPVPKPEVMWYGTGFEFEPEPHAMLEGNWSSPFRPDWERARDATASIGRDDMEDC